MQHQSFIALGSNLKEPLQQVIDAVEAIKSLGRVVECSPWYASVAIGPGEQPDYVNGVLLLETALEPHALLKALQTIESQQGRIRDIRWGARTLDLDILLFDNDIIETNDLIVPHPRMTERAFVMYPLADIAADLVLPHGESVADVKARLSQVGLEKLAQTR